MRLARPLQGQALGSAGHLGFVYTVQGAIRWMVTVTWSLGSLTEGVPAHFLALCPKQTLYDGNKYTCCWGLLSGLPQGRQGGEGLLAWPALPTWAETGWCSCRGAVCGGLRCSSSSTQPCPHRMPYEGNRAFREEPTCGWGQVGAGSPLPPLPLCVLSGQGLVQGECGDRAPTHGQLCGCEELLSAWLHAAAPAQEACL